MYLKKNGSYKKPFQTNMSGISLKAKGAKLRTFEIIEVRENSPAEEVGILTGDLLVSVNGRPAGVFELNELTGELSSKPGRKLSLELNRNGQIVRKTIILREEI
jgi:C-terminal processing protease CtpA/Prc